METQVVVISVVLLCACLASASSPPSNTRKEDLKKLANLLTKLKKIERVRMSSSPSAADYTKYDDIITDADAILKNMEGMGSPVNKRQGAWSYDYGLGGGRFGKRNVYGDYGIGGGRFGRDVDHVDVGETHDSES